jgi:hypothetical protein
MGSILGPLQTRHRYAFEDIFIAYLLAIYWLSVIIVLLLDLIKERMKKSLLLAATRNGVISATGTMVAWKIIKICCARSTTATA